MKRLSIKKSTVIAFLGILLIFTGVAFSISEGIYPETYKDCGKIKNKIVVPGGYKRSGETFLGVQFEKTRFKAVQVDETTYLKYEVGDFVCFNLQKDQTAKDKAWILFKLGSWLILFFGGGAYLLSRALSAENSESK